MQSLSFLHIGMRKVKSLIAVLVSFIVWQLIRLAFPSLDSHPGFAYMYAVLEIRETYEKTKLFGMRRIRATFVGLLVGLGFIALRSYFGTLADASGAAYAGMIKIGIELLLILLGVLLTLTFAQGAKCVNFCGVACCMFIVCFVWHADGNQYFYAGMRVFQTLIGVFSAWGVNWLIAPRRGN